MIKISVDYGYAFDMLAISEIKNQISNNNEAYDRLSNEIKNEIGEDKFADILNSQEYQNLLKANKIVFDLVDQAQKSTGLSKEMDSMNYQRYATKVILQKKFFNTNPTEIKIGYK